MNRQLLLDVLPEPAPSLENFVAGPNAAALEGLRALRPGRAAYFWGPAGCGRSHLLRAAGMRAGARYLDASAAPAELAEAAPETGPAPSLVAVDDVHRLDAAQQAALFALYNRWRESAASDRAFALAVAGDRAPMALALREDLRTRLGWDLVFRLELLSDTDKLAALTLQAGQRGLQLGPEVLNWILTRYERDMRRLASLLDALDRYSLATGRAITIPMLRAMLADQEASTRQ
ncbi:DnaA regulatory inactivator Hda [Orrella sp. JC864]|uniref:DnaA regulatory inactivator Hda n=1 Tax=Orrella sp. JC864 TaxID=3120298 RepID=UPI0012BD510C